MIGLILVCHGNLAESMVETAEAIVGPMDGVRTVSNQTKSAEAVSNELNEAIASFAGADGVLILVDVFGSSCWRYGLCNARDCVGVDYPIAVVSGAGLGTLLSFSRKRITLGFHELAEALADDSRRSIAGPMFFHEEPS